MHKAIVFAGMILFLATTLCLAEELTITTYYPSPFGVYNQLLTNRLGIGDNSGDGTLNDADAPTTDGEVQIAARVKAPEYCNKDGTDCYDVRSFVPSGAVMAFNSGSCPPGWDEFEPAYGRFIRGVDRGEITIDPDGVRDIGHIQDDEFESHDHSETTIEAGSGLASGGGYRAWGGTTGLKGGDETRPKNVALLYCIKN